MTAYGNIPLAVEAMREGAWDFLAKPFKKAELEHARRRRRSRSRHWPPRTAGCALELAGRRRQPPLVGQSAAIQRVMTRRRAGGASSRATVLITGESGTGKEVHRRERCTRSARGATTRS